MDTRAFVARYGIRASVRWADDNPNMDDMPAGSSHWRVTLRQGRRQLTVPFSMGPAHSREPGAADVLDCLASDAASIENARDFEDWAADFGFDPDSRKAEGIYRASERQTAGLRRLLDLDAYRILLWETDRL